MSAHTRMPVWEGEPDRIVGIVNTKDLFHIFSLMNLVILEDAMYPALYVDPDVSLGVTNLRWRGSRGGSLMTP